MSMRPVGHVQDAHDAEDEPEPEGHHRVEGAGEQAAR